MNKNVVAVCLTAIVISILGVAGWVAANAADAERILGWVGTTVGPLVAAIAAYIKVARVSDEIQAVSEDVHEVSEDVGVVKGRTNGNLDQIFTRLRALEQAGPTHQAPGATPAVTHAETEEGPPSATAPG